MLYILKIADYLKILTDEEIKNFVLIYVCEFFESTGEIFYSKLREEKQVRKVAVSLYSFLTTPDEVEKYVELTEKFSTDSCAHHYNIDIFNPF